MALTVQHEKRMRRIILSCVLSDCTSFFHVISPIARFSVIRPKNIKRALILSENFVRKFSHSTNISARTLIKVHTCLCKNTHYCCQVLIQLYFSWQIFEQFSYIKHHENPSIRSRVVRCGLARGLTGGKIWASFSQILLTRLKRVQIFNLIAVWFRNDVIKKLSQKKMNRFSLQSYFLNLDKIFIQEKKSLNPKLMYFIYCIEIKEILKYVNKTSLFYTFLKATNLLL